MTRSRSSPIAVSGPRPSADPGKETARDWGVTGTPETFFLRANGEVVAHVIGTISDGQMTTGVAAARSGRPAGVRSGGARRPTR